MQNVVIFFIEEKVQVRILGVSLPLHVKVTGRAINPRIFASFYRIIAWSGERGDTKEIPDSFSY